MATKFSIVPSALWVKRGVAKAKPTKVKLPAEELRNLIDNSGLNETSDDEEEKMEAEAPEGGQPTLPRKGLRGSLSNLTISDGPENDKYRMGDYDEEEGVHEKEGLRGVACFASDRDDPFITNVVDSDDDSDVEDFTIKENDNLVVAVKAEDEDYSLVCYIYNHFDQDWYVHHHYDLPAPALVVEKILFDPGSEDSNGNLVAVGSIDSTISIWDLDVVDLAEAVVTLGDAKNVMNIGKKKKKTASTTESALNHADAVLSLTWNENMKHVLASGGADGQVLLWDLDKAECVAKVSHVTGNAQGLEWHPTEASQILAGTMSGLVSLVDCRTMGGELRCSWTFGSDAEVNKLKWDQYNHSCAYVACEDGKLRYIDIRAPGKAVYSVDAHDDGVQALSLNYMVKDMLVTCGGEELKVWKNDSTTATLAHTQTLDLGPLMMVACCPDIPNVIVAGGRANDLIKTLDISKFKGVVDTFN